MNTIETLLAVADDYKRLSGVELDQTVSYRVFGDSKKLAALRTGSDITVRRYNEALCWFSENWPEDVDRPSALPPLLKSEDAA